MIIFIHVTIALASIIAATMLAFAPSRVKLYTSATLIALTLLSGTYLVVSLHVPLLHACMEGLVYLAVAMSAVIVGYRRLVHANETIEK